MFNTIRKIERLWRIKDLFNLKRINQAKRKQFIFKYMKVMTRDPLCLYLHSLTFPALNTYNPHLKTGNNNIYFAFLKCVLRNKIMYLKGL